MKLRLSRLKKLTYAQCYLASALLLVASLPFSYQPLIRLGEINGAHYDLTIIYITAGILVALSGRKLWQNTSELLHARYNLLLLLFGAWCIFSSIWSSNQLRATATAGVVALMILVVFSLQLHRSILVKYSRIIWRTALITLAVVITFCFWQLFADALGIYPAYTLLPEMYRSPIFGFARVTGFSAEPQFLGSLLLAPLAVIYFRYIRQQQRLCLLLSLLLFATLTLTLSRGALVAGTVITVLALAVNFRRVSLSMTVKSLIVAIGGILIGVTLLVAAAGINTRDNISSYQALAKSADQLSLGVIKLPVQSNTKAAKGPAATQKPVTQKVSSGYVASSTTSRLQMSGEALKLFASKPSNIIIGTGIGSFGTSLHAAANNFPQSSVVGDHYLETLVETGLIGAILFFGFFFALFKYLWHEKHIIAITTIIALLVQWLFFSGYPNILHIWIIIAFAVIFGEKATNRRRDSL